MVGIALFGSVTYLPLYLQVVRGASPTQSGLEMLPLMAGVLIAAIGSGQLITRYGRYKLFPIVGTALMVVGMLLLSRLDVMTSIVLADLYMFVLGLGLGFTMQVLVLALQNAVDYADLGVATSSATLFREMGGTIGVPIFGAIFSNKLASELAAKLPAGVAAKLPSRLGPSQIDQLPPAIHDPYVAAYAAAIQPMFLIAAVIAAAGFCITWLLQEKPLRETVADQGIGDSFATPREITSLDELETRLSTLERKDEQHRVYDMLTERAGLELSAPQAWMLLRLVGEHDATDDALTTRLRRPAAELQPLLDQLRSASLVEPDLPQLTSAGEEAADGLLRARCDALEELLRDWKPEEHPDILNMIQRYARSFTSAPPAPAPN